MERNKQEKKHFTVATFVPLPFHVQVICMSVRYEGKYRPPVFRQHCESVGNSKNGKMVLTDGSKCGKKQ